MKRLLALALLGSALLRTAEARCSSDKVDSSRTVPVSSWLVLGPAKTSLPLYHSEKNIKDKTFDLPELLEFDPADIHAWRPGQGDKLLWSPSRTLLWTPTPADTGGFASIRAVDSDGIELAYFVSYVNVDRFLKASLEVSGFHLFTAFVDGVSAVKKTKSDLCGKDSTGIKPGSASKDITLETGTHLILVKALRDPKCAMPWNLKAVLRIPAADKTGELMPTLLPEGRMTVETVLSGPRINGCSISPDGELAVVEISRSSAPKFDSETWTEIRRTKDGGLEQTFRGGMSLSRISWAPSGKRFTHTASRDNKTTLWLTDLDKGGTEALLQNVENFEGYSWAPDGSFILYTVEEKVEPGKTGLRKIEGMPDRQPGWKDRSFLYKLNLPGKISSRLTAGKYSTRLLDIRPDGKKAVISRSWDDFSERPFDKTRFDILDLETLALDSLWTGGWIQDAFWSPDGKTLGVLGGPSAFGQIGWNVPEGKIPNESDTELYLCDINGKRTDPVTQNFDPALGRAIWSRADGCLWFSATDRSFRNLYRYDPKTRTFTNFQTGVDVVDGFDIALNRPIAVVWGSGPNRPPKASVLDIKTGKIRLLVDPSHTDPNPVRYGKVEPWTFRNAAGTFIDGMVYYPPDFRPDRTWPCIVNFYGGTSPVSRDFGGRYPKEVWAANGYVVYVLQPSGATGYGQAFSALHVNDWGTVVADEIIEGTRQFVKAHPFVDPKRVGCIGASYGGFMTMLVLTKTDMFATGISHAGISSISSYWGEGYWGYSYSATATANSFPWNRPDIYVNQSALFSADKVTTPLLLLHGKDDTNVPPGESIQFYTALKLLGKTVEYIEVEGQNHHIMDPVKRLPWTKTIIAWFDKYLKGQSEWWEELYPAAGAGK